MDYLVTTGSRLHDLELDRILSRLAAVENASPIATTTAPVTQVLTAASGVSSLTLTGTAAMQGDLIGTLAGNVTATQTAPAAFTLTVPPILTTKGDLLGFGSSLGRLAVGSNTQVLTADSTQTLGVKWASPGAMVVPTNVLVISPGSAPISWIVPSALTEFNANKMYRAQHDLTNATQARIFFAFPSVALLLSPPVMAAQYSTDNGATWNYMDGSSGPTATYSGVDLVSAWVTLAAGAKADVLLRITGSSGDGVTAVSFGSVYLQTK